MTLPLIISEKECKFKEKVQARLPEGGNLNRCYTCGTCVSGCPAARLRGMDPRKLLRMVLLGLDEEVGNNPWVWMCTMCARCEINCPMGIKISDLVRQARSERDREEIPGILQQGLEMALSTGNNLGLPRADFIFILEDVGEELAEEPGFEDFTVPIDEEGANILITIHNKLVNTQNEDLKHWWKIFHAAGEKWTIPSDEWEGTSWGFFTGDEPAVKTMTGRMVDHMDSLKVGKLLYPE